MYTLMAKCASHNNFTTVLYTHTHTPCQSAATLRGKERAKTPLVALHIYLKGRYSVIPFGQWP